MKKKILVVITVMILLLSFSCISFGADDDLPRLLNSECHVNTIKVLDVIESEYLK